MRAFLECCESPYASDRIDVILMSRRLAASISLRPDQF